MILVVETITWKPHIETAIEIALRRRDAGEEVRFCNLRRGLPACEDESAVHRLLDLPATRIRRAGAVLRSQGICTVDSAYDAEQRRQALEWAATQVAACGDIEAVKRMSCAGYYDLGWGVISSAVSMTHNSTLQVRGNAQLLTRLAAAGRLAYEQTCALIKEHRPDRLLVFNGRFATTRASLRAAEEHGVPWLIHERGGNRNRYWVTDCVPHDMDAVQAKIREHWRPELADIGRRFFESRRGRQEQAWHSFAEAQSPGLLPDEMREPGEWITFFTSAEDEMFAIGDTYRNVHFPDQRDAINTVAAACAKLPGTRLCIRVHPHVAEKSPADQMKWQAENFPGALVIGPRDPTDSYALLERSRVACSYGSTIGIEATYWGKPSLSFSPSYYDKLGVTELARSPEQVLAYCRDPVPFPRDATLPYGAFWELLGEEYRYYKADGLHRGSICGVYLDDAPVMRLSRGAYHAVRRMFGSRR